MNTSQHDRRCSPNSITGGVVARVKELRTETRMTAAVLAEKMRELGINWTRITVAKLETGRRESVSVDELVALSGALKTSTKYLLGEETCPACRDSPPEGFTCNQCSRSATPPLAISK